MDQASPSQSEIVELVSNCGSLVESVHLPCLFLQIAANLMQTGVKMLGPYQIISNLKFYFNAVFISKWCNFNIKLKVHLQPFYFNIYSKKNNPCIFNFIIFYFMGVYVVEPLQEVLPSSLNLGPYRSKHMAMVVELHKKPHARERRRALP